MPDPFVDALTAVRDDASPDPFLTALADVRGTEPTDTRSTFARVVDRLNQPLLPQIQTTAHRVADSLSQPHLGEAQLNEAIPGAGTLAAMLRGGVAGSIEGLGNVIGSFSSPLGVLATLSGVGAERAAAAGLVNAARALRATEAATGAAFGARGLEQAATATSLPDAALGLSQAAAGALGVRGGLTGLHQAEPLPAATTVRGALPPGASFIANDAGLVGRPDEAIPMTPQPDGSFVRAVPAEYARREVRGALPAGPRFVAPEEGAAIPVEHADPFLRALTEIRGTAEPSASPPDAAASYVRSVPAAPLGYEVQDRRIVPTHYSSDVNATPAPHVELSPTDEYALRWIRQDLDQIPFTPRTFNETVRRGGDLEVVPGAAGAPIYRAIVGDEGRELVSASRADVIRAIDHLLQGKLTKTGELALGVARDLADGDARLQRLMVTGPPDITPPADAPVDTTPPASTEMSVDDWAEALAREGDKPIADLPFALLPEAAQRKAVQPSLLTRSATPMREPGEEGVIDPVLAARLGLGAAGGAYGYATGDTPADRAKRMLLFGGAGVLAPSLFEAGGAVAAGANAAGAARSGPAAPVVDRVFETNTKARGRAPETDVDLPLNQLATFPPEQRADLLKLLRDNHGFSTARGGRQTWASIDAKALQTAVNLSRPGRRGAALPQEIGAFKNALATLQDKAETLAEKIRSGAATDLDKLEFQKANADRVAAASGLFGRVSESGRALNYSKQLAKIIESADIRFVRQALKQVGDPATVAEALTQTKGDPIAQLKYLQSQQALTPLGLARGVFFQNILSGVKTTLRNVVGNTVNAATDFLIRPLATVPLDVAESALTGRPRAVYFGELGPRLQGLIVGIPKAARDALFELQYGFPREATFAGSFDRLPPELPGGLATNFFTRFLQAQDTFQFTMLRESEEWGRAFAKVQQQGGAGGRRWAARIADAKLALSAEDKAAAAAEAERLLFREDPGAFVDWIAQGKRKFPAMDFVIPFIKISSNQIRQALERSPAGALLPAVRAAGRAGVEARGRMIGGTAALVGLAYYVGLNRISGDGPTDPGERNLLYARGWRPNSVRLGIPDALARSLGATRSEDGTYWVSYLGLPIAPVLAALANGHQTWLEHGRKPEDATSIATETVFKSINSVLAQSFWASALGLMESLQDPERYAAQYVRQLATSAVPLSGLSRNIAQAVDPTIRRPQTIPQSIESIVPGLSQHVPPRLDVFGQPSQRPGNAFQRGFAVAPMALSPTVGDPISAALQDVGITLQTPRPDIRIRGEKVALSQEQRDALVEAIGRERRARLARVVDGGGFPTLSDAAKAKLLRRAIADATDTVDTRARLRLRRGEPLTADALRPQ